MKIEKSSSAIAAELREIIEQARRKAYGAVAYAMTEAYWKIGQRIVKEEQKGSDRAIYGNELINRLAEDLGKGFSARSLREYRQLYSSFPIWEDLAHACAKLNRSAQTLNYERIGTRN